nr:MULTISPECIES: hypothetical protein [unclassified Tatumella]
MAAVGSALAWPLLPAAAATTSLIGAGANAGVGYLMNGEVNPNDVILGYWTGALTAGTGLWGTIAVNAGSGATSSWIKGDDPLKGGVISGAAIGSGIKGENPINSMAGAGFGSVAGGIAGKVASEVIKPVVKETTSEVAEAAIGSITSEVAGNKVKEQLDHGRKK